MKRLIQRSWVFLPGLLLLLAVACAVQRPTSVSQHRWWVGLGPVLPHDSFPADCTMCHVGDKWNTLVEDFEFDHERETGFALYGAHDQAQCLRCHNDRGPVATFQARGCAGCHEDVHLGDLGTNCDSCHEQDTWYPEGQIEQHNQTRFPLIGVHAATSCRRCHIGGEVGNFLPLDTECVTCHADDLANAQNPNHILLGLLNNCDRCHIPTDWNQGLPPD